MDMEHAASIARASISATITAERNARGWSRDDLAARTRVRAQSIGRYERGEREVGTETLARLAGAFGLSLSQFMALAEERATRLEDPASGQSETG